MVEVGSSLQAGRPVEVEIPNWVSRPDPSWGEAESRQENFRAYHCFGLIVLIELTFLTFYKLVSIINSVKKTLSTSRLFHQPKRLREEGSLNIFGHFVIIMLRM